MSVDRKAIESPGQSAPAADPQSPGDAERSRASNAQPSSASTTPSSPAPAAGNADVSQSLREMFKARMSGGAYRPAQAQPVEEATVEADVEPPTAPKETVPASAEGSPEKRADEAKRESEAPVQLTQAEIDRRVQAETDRRLAKFQREEAQRRKREETQALRDKDPYAYAARMKEEEEAAVHLQKQIEEADRMAKAALEAYDTTVLDPLIMRIPESDRSKILESIDPGIPGRGQAASRSLEYLQRMWKKQGETEARKTLLNDNAFVKEVLAKYGGGRIEPDMVPAAGASGPAFNMNSAIRTMAGRR